ncbi:hypothetical protein JXQ31_01830 [candidate division KSB1 bacterium]|nr:hypothetical protein [candidate division KSB1 bacterium]
MIKSQKCFAIILLTGLFLLAGCAGTFKGFRSSSSKVVKKAPYYDGKKITVNGNVGLLPVEMDIRLYRAYFENDRKHALEPLIEAIDKAVCGFEKIDPLDFIDLPPEQAPDIYMGNVESFNSPATHTGTDENDEDNQMVLYRYSPSSAWKDSLLARAGQNQVDYFLFITVGFSEYFLRMKNLLGSKELSLGTGYSIPSEWLTDLDTPAEVLHVTGALLDKNGKILRCGAEGIIAKKTGFLKSLIDLQELISNEEIANLLNNDRREDLPGTPLKWEAAVQNLTGQLLGRDNMIVQQVK